VFVGELGGFLDSSALRRRFKRARDKAGLRPLRFHDLRHRFGSIAIRVADPREVQEWLGHADFTTTQIYMHYKPRADAARRLSAGSRERIGLPCHLRAGSARWLPRRAVGGRGSRCAALLLARGLHSLPTARGLQLAAVATRLSTVALLVLLARAAWARIVAPRLARQLGVDRHERRLAPVEQPGDLIASTNLKELGGRFEQMSVGPTRAVERLLNTLQARTCISLEGRF
jgi:hypothetical protein